MNRGDPIGRSADTLTDRTRRLLRDERIADRSGWLQAVHPAVKLLGVLALLALTVTFKRPVPPAGVLILTIGLAILSRVPLSTHAVRTAIPTSLALVVVLPQLALLSGTPLVGPVTVSGAEYVATFVLRVGASVSLLFLLLSTTRFSSLMGAFRTLRIPRPAVALLTITYRYLVVVFEELTRLVLARRSRRIRSASIRESWREAASLLGTFILGTLERGERVGRAARARGGTTGRAYRPQTRIGLPDAAFTFVVVATVTAGVTIL